MCYDIAIISIDQIKTIEKGWEGHLDGRQYSSCIFEAVAIMGLLKLPSAVSACPSVVLSSLDKKLECFDRYIKTLNSTFCIICAY